jgi:hypothetical protein
MRNQNTGPLRQKLAWLIRALRRGSVALSSEKLAATLLWHQRTTEMEQTWCETGARIVQLAKLLTPEAATLFLKWCLIPGEVRSRCAFGGCLSIFGGKVQVQQFIQSFVHILLEQAHGRCAFTSMRYNDHRISSPWHQEASASGMSQPCPQVSNWLVPCGSHKSSAGWYQ